ncbi:MAG: peptidoglycan-binding protein [Patescibacteria group bacterium]
MKRTFLTLLVAVLFVSIVIPASLTFAKTSTSKKTPPTASVQELQEKYADATGKDKIRILVMPGHEPDFGGAVYQGVYEREIVVETADQLASYLEQNPRFEVIVARSNTGWNEDLADYFDGQWSKIEKFVNDKKKAMAKLISRGDITMRSEDEQVDHATAPTDSALRLYGINKWADENDIDLVVHLHINDTTDHGPSDPSAYSGYAVYVPDSQYGNSKTSEAVGEAIANRLSTMNATSTLPIENQGVVEDQQLIAIGAYDTLSVPSILIEYAYITEPKFNHPEVRQTVTKDYAYETYLGIQDFFKDPVMAKYPTASLPYTFTGATVGTSSPQTYALQAALHTLGFYPTYASTTPANVRLAAPTLTMCPIDGVMGSCTTDAIEAFQIAKGIKTTGTLDPQTLYALNTLFSDQPVTPILPSVPAVTTTTATTTSVSATTSCSLPTHDLALKATDTTSGGDVSRLQRLLSTDATLYPEKLVTGTFGPATLKAVQKFQLTKKLATEGAAGYGLVGPKTRSALQTLCK